MFNKISISQMKKLAFILLTFVGFIEISMAKQVYSDPTGYLNDHGYVDLSLPSGNKWATCNVGAKDAYYSGEYCYWGIDGSKPDSTYNSKFSIAGTNSDIATVDWEEGWRTPSDMDWIELKKFCKWKWTTINGQHGYLITGKNQNSIFLPASGYNCTYGKRRQGATGAYWSATYNPYVNENSTFVSYLHFNLHRSYVAYCTSNYGQQVRPVCSK